MIRLHLWPLRVLWVVLGLAASASAADALDDRSTPVVVALNVLGWAAWGAVLVALLVLGLPAGLWFCWLAGRWHRGRTATESRFARTVHAAAAILADFRDPRLFGIPFLQSCLMMAATILCVMSLASAIGGVAAPAWGQALFLPVIFLLSNLPISIAGIAIPFAFELA